MKDRTEELFGAPIAVYTRAQALEDGVLVDVSDCVQPCPFKWPVAMTRAAWASCIVAGGTWTPDRDGKTLDLPNGQDVKGRMHDVFQMLLATMKNPRMNALQRQNTDNTRVYFSMLVDERGDGRKTRVELYSACGPGDNAEPVITIMLQGED